MNRPCRCTLCPIVWGFSNFFPFKWNYELSWRKWFLFLDWIICTLFCSWCLHHMAESKASKSPMARHRSPLKSGLSLKHLLYFSIAKPYQGGCKPHCKSLSLRAQLSLSWVLHTSHRCAWHLRWFPWEKKQQEFMCSRYYSFLVLFLFPNPHLTEQDVHSPHGPTSQSAEKKEKLERDFTDFFRKARKILGHIWKVTGETLIIHL